MSRQLMHTMVRVDDRTVSIAFEGDRVRKYLRFKCSFKTLEMCSLPKEESNPAVLFHHTL